ncbi:MAG: hypothetical protein IIA72_12650 [Proteobacteria bacterium]|nr:hypothetical protein [Pseudomonadota bacterium]
MCRCPSRLFPCPQLLNRLHDPEPHSFSLHVTGIHQLVGPHGGFDVIRHAKRRGTTSLPWLADLIARRPTKVAAVALANKMARMAWALLRHGGTYRKPTTAPAA